MIALYIVGSYFLWWSVTLIYYIAGDQFTLDKEYLDDGLRALIVGGFLAPISLLVVVLYLFFQLIMPWVRIRLRKFMRIE